MPAVIGPFLFWLLNPRLERWDLIWTDIMDQKDRSEVPRLPMIGGALICDRSMSVGWSVGFLLSIGAYSFDILGNGRARQLRGTRKSRDYRHGGGVAPAHDHRGIAPLNAHDAALSFEALRIQVPKGHASGPSRISISPSTKASSSVSSGRRAPVSRRWRPRSAPSYPALSGGRPRAG